ncbi:MAG: HD domain-containing protein [Treponema sp.]|nr:HD domain-containing protein [Treponema sp.]
MEKETIDFQSLVRVNSELSKIQDLDILLEQILFMARKVVSADAGSIYVRQTASKKKEEPTDELQIKHAQNDTFQKSLPPGEKQVYSRFSVPINEKSISGYCAHTRKTINLPDMYNIPTDAPYSFNSIFDKLTGYKTTSTLTFPLATEERLLGVIQVINKMDKQGNVISFSEEDELVLTNFASSATAAMQRAYLTRAMIMRMIKMSELRDPKETGSHVNRVAGYTVEIYDRWAYIHKIPGEERRSFRDILRIGAMLHDVGKVAISDMLLKKPARFTPEEFLVMKHHTVYGASLFDNPVSAVDNVAMEIALTHHENWDGTGYPGWIDPVTNAVIKGDESGRPLGKKGDEIPLAGRLVAIADVFDALSSKRVYKDPWSEDQVLEHMRELSGTKFDPELLGIFFEVLPIIKHIQKLYPEEVASD